jgi:putative nucleotidyltransferase with HDIG domain
MYIAKRGGRNQVMCGSQMSDGDPPLPAEHNKVDHLCRQLAGLDAKFKRLFVESIGGLINALEARDEHTANHSVKVRCYAMLIAKEMNLLQATVEHIGRAAMLHDIGKIGLPDNVLLKEGALTETEWQLVRRHPIMSVRIMEGMEFLDQEIPAVRYHHERFDGGGYPEGLAGSSIPLGARILAVADSFDAMVSSRVYREGMGVEAALEEIRAHSGTQFDPAVVEAFFQAVQEEKINDQTVAAATPPTKLSA